MLKKLNFRGWQTLVDKDQHIGPYFAVELRRRVHKKLATNVVVTGEPGIGKSYAAIDICRVLDGRTRPSNKYKRGRDRFKLDQITFLYKDFLRLTLRLKMGKPTMFDEPSYAMSKRDWYKEINKALVLTIESKRFKVHPLFIPIVNKSLLDKTLRSYMIQFQVEVKDRGHAEVYRIVPSQASEKVYRYHFCTLRYQMFDADICDIDSCLDCKEILTCNLLRARYERKKATIQDERYETALDQAEKQEAKTLSLKHMVIIAQGNEEIMNLLKDGKITHSTLSVIMEEVEGIYMSYYRGRKVLSALRRWHKQDST